MSHDIAVVTPGNIHVFLGACETGDQKAITTLHAIDEFMGQSHTCMKCGSKFSPANPAIAVAVVLDPEVKHTGHSLLQHVGDGRGVAALCDNCVRGREAECMKMIGDCLDLEAII